jgi:hypothetical protein
MEPFLLSAALLLAALGLFHSILGERYIVRRLLRRDNLPRLFGGDSFTKATIRYAWHLLTLWALGVALVLLGWSRGAPQDVDSNAAGFLALTFAASAVWGIVATRGRHLSWLVLLLIAVFIGVGARLGIPGF